jgi:hypothetical protein
VGTQNPSKRQNRHMDYTTQAWETKSQQGSEMLSPNGIPEPPSVVSLGGGLHLPGCLRRGGKVLEHRCRTSQKKTPYRGCECKPRCCFAS